MTLGLAAASLAIGSWTPVGADEAPLPDSCKLHPTHVVNPGCVPDATSEINEPSLTFPDLVPDVTEVYAYPDDTYDPETETWIPGPTALRFDTWAQNLGTVPLELVVDELQYDATSTVSQCVAWTATYACRERRQVGGFAWHDEHKHYHYQDFARYELRRLASDGRPDYSDAGLVQVSEKVSFCLVDSTWVGTTPSSPPTHHQMCSPTRQGITHGWADVYASLLDGQGFSLVDPPDGLYAIVVSMNTSGSLYEADRTNNRVEVIIELSNDAQAARIVSKSRS